jgi:hypothetical protein
MATISKSETIVINTTPNELRKLADKMEKAWAISTIGQDLTVEKWLGDPPHGLGVNIAFAIDQSQMPLNESGLGIAYPPILLKAKAKLIAGQQSVEIDNKDAIEWNTGGSTIGFRAAISELGMNWEYSHKTNKLTLRLHKE